MSEAKPAAVISGCHRNIMGTVSFNARFPGMRKPDEFIVYPMQESTTTVSIQSGSRFGQIDLELGAVEVTPRTSGHPGFVYFELCHIRKLNTQLMLSTEERETLRQWIKSTGGPLVGASFVKSDNTGALAL